MSNSLRPEGLQDTRLPCPSPTPGACSNSCPSSGWCHPTISSLVIPFFHLQSLPTAGSFQMSQLFTWGGQNIGASTSASVLPIQDWLPLGSANLISLQSKGLSRIFSNTTVQKNQLFSVQLSLWFNSRIHTWLLEKTYLLLSYIYIYIYKIYRNTCVCVCSFCNICCCAFASLLIG